MNKVIAVFGGLLTAATMAVNAQAQTKYKVTKNWGYEGNYLIEHQFLLEDGVIHQKAFILDCPTGDWSFWNLIS